MTWAEGVYRAANWTSFLLGTASLAAACLLVAPGGWADRTKTRLRRSGLVSDARCAAVVLGVILPGLLVLFKTAQHKNSLLGGDSAHIMNYGWNAAQGNGLFSSIYGQPFLAIHFQFTTALLSPLLLLWRDAQVFILLHGLALGSAISGVFLLARRRTGSLPFSWLMALLALAHPLFQDLIGTVIEDSVFAAPLFIWAAYLFETGHPAVSALALGVFLTTKEQATAVLCGSGLYLLLRADRRPRLGWTLFLLGALLAVVEVGLIEKARRGLPCAEGFGWMFPQLGSSPREAARNLFLKPWLLPAALLFPAKYLLPGLAALLHCAFLPLLSGSALLPVYLAWLPHQLAGAHSNYHAMSGYYGAFVLGPLLWATVLGAERVWRRCDPGQRRALASGALCIAALGLLGSAGRHNPRLTPSSWREGVPKMAVLIAPDAKLWCESALSPHFALRRYIKGLPGNLPDCNFQTKLFRPDQVLLSTHWIRLQDPSAVGPIMEYLKREGYATVAQDRDLILLERPGFGGPQAGTRDEDTVWLRPDVDY